MNLLISAILFAQLTMPFETKVFLDADGQFLIYARYFQGDFISIDSVRSINDYFENGLQTRNLDLLTRELEADILQQGGYASKGIFGTFEIPLPKGGFGDFMGETGKLDVGGYVKITFGGSETFVSNLPGQDRPSLLPELEMKQEMAINLDGQVGDRMRVYIDHNSERVDETQNKIRVTYLGREDDIIQEIEGGDTQLSIPATNYTGDIPSHSGLFGLKATAKVGPLDLVAIASNEQTQTQETEITGSIQSDTASIWAKYYEKRRFFYLGTNDSIISLQIYIDDNNGQNNNLAPTFYGNAYLDIYDDNIPDDTTNPTNHQEGYFTIKYEGFDNYYIFEPGVNIIELNAGLPTQSVLGVYYVVKKNLNGLTVIDTVGHIPSGLGAGDTIQLKLICPELLDTTSYTWHYEKKNYYQILSPGSRLDSLRIYYVTSGENRDRQNNVPYIELLGLDQYPKDGMVDQNRVWFPDRGLLIFPDSIPFASDTLTDPDPIIYMNPYYMSGNGKYYIFKKTIEAKPVFPLPDNVIKVWVYVDDILQDSVNDYHADYENGTLEFKKVLPPTSKIRIKTEYAPYFSASQKSLLGMRGSMNPFGNVLLGSSFFYRTESYPAEHTRLREEPFNRMVWEVDFSMPQTLPWATQLVDWLPLVETEEESKINLNFEGAYSFSNLNSRGQVWLDDLESSTIITSDASITRTFWIPSSKPVNRDTVNFVSQRLTWYNPQDEDRLQASDIYVNPLDPNEIADVLKIIFKADNPLSFAGLTQYVYSENYDETENLEILLKGKGGRLHVEIAQEIDEDQLRRNHDGVLVGVDTLNDENRDAYGTWNEQTEDTGLDGIYGADSLNVTGDDGNDDFKDRDYTGGINGPEGNRAWDTEDIDHNGVLNRENRYHSYSMELDSTAFLVENAGLKEGWKMFRVPIKDSLLWDTVVNQPDWHNIRYIRIWFDNFVSTETLLIYKLGVTGSRWKNYGITGVPPQLDTMNALPTETFVLTPVNTKTHSYYKPPYPNETDPLTGEVKSEGGLELRLENIEEGHTCIAHRNTDDYEDYRAYDTLTFFLNALHSSPVISMRLGSDSLNYYEYATEYENGTLGYNSYRLFHVSFARFLDLKSISHGDSTVSAGEYKVVGNPSLTVNRFFELRITNQLVTTLTDTIWFNDVKLTSPKREIGRILRGNGSINFADLASLAFAYNESNGKFRRLTESKDISTSSAGRSYVLNSGISLDKFLPESWDFNIPVGLNYSKSIQDPRYSYLANDLDISGEDQIKQRSTGIGKSYTVHFSKANSKNWFLKQTLDRLSLDHSRSNNYSQSVLNCDTSQSINYSGSYSQDPKFNFKMLKQTFHLFPQNLSFSAQYADNLSKSYYRTNLDSSFLLSTYGSQHRKTLNPSFSASYSPHSIINTGFNFSQDRDSVSPKRRFGEEVGRHQTFDASVSKDLKIATPHLYYNAAYNEDHRFEIRQDQDLRNVSNNARYGISSSVNLRDAMKFFTRLRDEKKDTLQKTGSPAWIAKQVEAFFDMIQNPTLSYSRNRYSNYLNVKTRPDVNYQWGLVDSIPSSDVAAGSYPGRGRADAYSMSSGLSYKVASVTGSYNGQINRTFNYSGTETKTKSTSYPNATLRISRLEVLPILKRYARSSSISAGFNQTIEQRFDVNADSAELVSDSKTIGFNPLVNWQASWARAISTTLDINYAKTTSNSYAGLASVQTISLNRGGSFSVAYTFSAPHGLRLPLLGGVRFASNLSLNLGLNYTRNTSYALDLITSDASSYGANVGLSYNFSSSITGGASFDYTRNKEAMSDQDSRRVGLNIWTNINF